MLERGWRQRMAEVGFDDEYVNQLLNQAQLSEDPRGVRIHWFLPLSRSHESADWSYTAFVAIRDGRLEVTEFYVSPVPQEGAVAAEVAPVGGLTASVMRQVSWGGLISSAKALAAMKLALSAGDRRYLDDALEAWRRSGPPKSRPARLEMSDLEYASLAARYAELLAEGFAHPTAILADELGYQPGTVNQRVREARKRGLLTAAPAGRAGGELTDKARGLLASEEGDSDGERS